MKILWIATKTPWPPVDGGRLLLFNTLHALADAGHAVTLVAPDLGDAAAAVRAREALRPVCRLEPVAGVLRPRLVDALRAQLRRRPWTLVRHALPAVRRRVAELLTAERFDVVQAEQAQAVYALPAKSRSLPTVWRAQNVESDLWTAVAARAGWRAPFFRLEARRLARAEGEAVRRTDATVALTAEDAARLAELAGGADRIYRVPAPFVSELPAAAEPLPGDPPVVLFGSGGWLPNRDGARWFLREVWPRLGTVCPGALLNLFGEPLPELPDRVVHHPSPADSRAAFPAGAVLAVPLHVASGVRMKILEAWARGVPVVATPAAARGLGAEPGRELLVAPDAAAFAAALQELAQSPARRAALVAAGRERLRSEHDLPGVARRLVEVYDGVRVGL